MPKAVGFGSLATALGGEKLVIDDADYDARIKNLPELAAEPELAHDMLSLTHAEFFVAHKWKNLGERLRKIYDEAKLNLPSTKDALRSFLFLALPSEQQISMQFEAPRKKKGVEDSAATKEAKKRKMKAQTKLSQILAAVLEAAYPPHKVAPLVAQAKAAKEAKDEDDAASVHSRQSAYSDDTAMDGGGNAGAGAGAGDDDDDDDATGGLAKLNLSKPRSASDARDEVEASEAKYDERAFKQGKQFDAFTAELVYEKTALVRAAAEKITEAHLLITTPPAHDAAGTFLYAVPEPIYMATGQLMTQLAATFKPDGTLTDAAAAAPQGTLPL
jgi:hypothetical protein